MSVHPRHLLVGLLLMSSLAACAGSSSSPPTPSPGATTSSPAAAPLTLVAIGDSIPLNSPDHCSGCSGFVSQYATALSSATGREVRTRNLSSGEGLTLPGLLDALPDLEETLRGADVVLVGIAHNSFPLNEEKPCGSAFDSETVTMADWTKVDDTCAAVATATYGPQYAELYATIARWRAGRPTALRTIDRYNDWIGWEFARLTPSEESRTADLVRAWNTMICDAAEAHAFICVGVGEAFNGPDGSRASGDLLGPDYVHPSQQGNDLVAKLLVEAGFAPFA